MGGVVSPISEPLQDAVPGSVFRAIPQSGVLTANDDTLLGGALMDGTVSGGAGDDLFSVNYSGFDWRTEINAQFGFASLSTAAGAYLGTVSFWDFERFVLVGGSGNDMITGALTGASTLRGGANDDILTIAGGGNLVAGGEGNDTIHGATLDDTVNGGAGTDLLVVDLSGAGAGVDLGRGFNPDNWRGIEQFAGTLTAHDDTLRGGQLLADAYGGAGLDFVQLDYSGLADAVSFDVLGPSYAYVSFAEPIGEVLSVFLWNFEQFDVRGTDQGDYMTGSTGNDLFTGLGGNDTLKGGGGQDTLLGGDGDDQLTGNPFAGSEIFGGAGDDSINVWRLDDTVAGGAGTDLLQLDLWESDRRAVVDLRNGMPNWTGVEAVTGFLSGFNDVFRTTTLNGSIDGGQGADLLALDYTRSGVDSISFSWGMLEVTEGGTAGFHWASGFERYDLRGSRGDDSLTGDSRADTLDGAGGNDRLDGAGANDVLIGGAGNDTLFGGDGNDTLDGGAGRDTLMGGEGNDVLTGGAGRDTFYFWGPSIGNDRITDFEAGTDRIVIDPVFEMVPVVSDGADALIDIMGQTIRVENATTTEVYQAIVYDYLLLI